MFTTTCSYCRLSWDPFEPLRHKFFEDDLMGRVSTAYDTSHEYLGNLFSWECFPPCLAPRWIKMCSVRRCRDKRLTTWEICQSNPLLCMKRPQLSAKAIMISQSPARRGPAVRCPKSQLFCSFGSENVGIIRAEKSKFNGFPSVTTVCCVEVWFQMIVS